MDSTSGIQSSLSMALYKFEISSELCIIRASSGCLTLQERTLVPGSTYVTQSTSLVSTKRCRCSVDGTRLAGFARAHCCGPFVVEIDGTLIGSSSTYLSEETESKSETRIDSESETGSESVPKTGKRKRKRDAIESDVLRYPPVGDERMISLLEGLFSGRNLDLHSNTSSDPQIVTDSSSTSSTSSILSDTVGVDSTSGSGSSSRSDAVSGFGSDFVSGVSSERHRTAAAFVYNNFIGGSLMFADYSVDVLPWSLLLPTVNVCRGLKEGEGEGEGNRVIAMALLDHARRCVEAYVITDHANGRTAPSHQYGERPTVPLFVSRKGILDACQLELD